MCDGIISLEIESGKRRRINRHFVPCKVWWDSLTYGFPGSEKPIYASHGMSEWNLVSPLKRGGCFSLPPFSFLPSFRAKWHYEGRSGQERGRARATTPFSPLKRSPSVGKPSSSSFSVRATAISFMQERPSFLLPFSLCALLPVHDEESPFLHSPKRIQLSLSLSSRMQRERERERRERERERREKRERAFLPRDFEPSSSLNGATRERAFPPPSVILQSARERSFFSGPFSPPAASRAPYSLLYSCVVSLSLLLIGVSRCYLCFQFDRCAVPKKTQNTRIRTSFSVFDVVCRWLGHQSINKAEHKCGNENNSRKHPHLESPIQCWRKTRNLLESTKKCEN